ncbi:transcriptional regulator, LacI family [Microlunatus soli]|uniref:Transcriptional regulator, LacI family n=1 Tax=Microlunatus soli TaxID=630515 RepID=A0A1H1WSP4_9ACTN|nr:transcriptional regulator, LacI family [Microlunatus soli]
MTGHDVARAAGVSQATVSLVFSDAAATRVSEQTRARVRAVARQLGYLPQASGRQLRLGRSGLVLLAVPDIRAPYFSRVLAGAHEAAEAGDLTVVASSSWDADKLVRIATNTQFDALIFCSPTDQQLERLPSGVPLVFLDADPDLASAGPDRLVVELDVADGMRRLLSHLRDLGHRRIGRLRYAIDDYTFRARQAAFAAATDGLRVSERPVRQAGDLDLARGCARDLLASPQRPTAVVCDDDVLAVAVYHAADQLGLGVPTDLSVVGMDDVDAAQILRPGLTTVDLGAESLGRKGIEAVGALLGDGRQPTAQGAELIIRESTGRPGR